MVDKAKPKLRQASLLEAPEDKPDSMDRLVAQAFDSDPRVRQKVADELGKTDDPRAIFALIELSSDKEEAVKAAAQRSLSHFKEESEAIVSLEKLFAERKEVRKPEEMPEVRQKMMPSIERLFSHYEPKKRDSVRRKLMPSLEKLFGFSARAESDPLHGVEKISHSAQAEPAPAPEASVPRENAANFPFGKHEEPPEKRDSVEVEEEDREIAFEDDPEGTGGMEEKGNDEQPAASKYYPLAYKIATTPGMGKAELKREQNRLLANFKKEIGLAFKMAEERAHEEGLANFSNLKPGMKNLSFAEMQIVSISDTGFGAKKKPFAKVRLSDGHKEVCVLIPSERAHGITIQDRLALKGVAADFLVEGNEVVLVVKNKSKVIVVK